MKRAEMNEKAVALRIDYTRFRNKHVLQTEIDRVSALPVYNTTDPCTLEDIETIDPNYKIEWTQHRYRFCADIRSIKQMFDNGHTILPWSIDFCSGIRATQDPEEYKRMFDMRYVPDLVSKVEAFSGPDVHQQTDPPPFHAHFIRGIEVLVGDSYVYGVVINRLLNATKTQIYQRVCGSMLNVLYNIQSSTISEDCMIRDVFYNYCYVMYSATSFHISTQENHLLYLLEILFTFNRIVGEPSKFIIQMLMTDL